MGRLGCPSLAFNGLYDLSCEFLNTSATSIGARRACSLDLRCPEAFGDIRLMREWIGTFLRLPCRSSSRCSYSCGSVYQCRRRLHLTLPLFLRSFGGFHSYAAAAGKQCQHVWEASHQSKSLSSYGISNCCFFSFRKWSVRPRQLKAIPGCRLRSLYMLVRMLQVLRRESASFLSCHASTQDERTPVQPIHGTGFASKSLIYPAPADHAWPRFSEAPSFVSGSLMPSFSISKRP